MATMTKLEQITEDLSALSVLEASELVKVLETKWGVSAAMPVMEASSSTGSNAVVEEKVDFDVQIVSVGDKKINVIKEVREITGLGLKEAKDLVDEAAVSPKSIKAGVSKDEAEKIKAKLEAVGAKVELK